MISLGTGVPPSLKKAKTKDDYEDESQFKMSAIKSLANFDYMMNFESETADKVMESVMGP